MSKLSNLKPERVFYYFEKICSIPRGSGNMNGISSYCMDFAKAHSLRAVRDDADNVVIYKDASSGYENSLPVILQGHLDMVCQKTENCGIDFNRDGIKPYVDGDYIRAEETTLGADNGIAIAMILAILESDCPHPPIEAVFTTDEEIGMIGAAKLPANYLSGARMINIDSEELDTLTVSCAGGSDFRITLPIKRKKTDGTRVTLSLKGLRGGHSGMEINSGRVNANILAGRILNHIKKLCNFDIIGIDGGDKGNAIPCRCTIRILTDEPQKFTNAAESCIKDIKSEIAKKEETFDFNIETTDFGTYEVMDMQSYDNLIFMLMCVPNGVMEMSADIEKLVETSLNIGILKTEQEKVIAHFTLRSNKKSALEFLQERLCIFAGQIGGSTEAFGHYPPWEYKENSVMQQTYIDVFKNEMGYEPSVEAIHAGLECGIFSSKIKNIDCISIGPEIKNAHTVEESLEISSVQKIFDIVLKMLEFLK